MGAAELMAFLSSMAAPMEVAASTQNQALSALLFLMECLRLRVKDLDIARREVMIREGKGGRDRVTVLTSTLVGPLADHLARVRTLFFTDRQAGLPGVELPGAYGRKNPVAGFLWGWHWVFPQNALSIDPRTGIRRRHQVYDQTFSRALSRAAKQAAIAKPVTAQVIRHATKSARTDRVPRGRRGSLIEAARVVTGTTCTRGSRDP